MLMNIRKSMVVALLLLGIATVFSSRLLADDVPQLKGEKNAMMQATGADSADPPLRVWRRTRSFMQLERGILEGVKLDDAQRETVKKAFADLYGRMKSNPSNAGFTTGVYSAYTPAELKVQRARVKAAESAGKKDLVKVLEAEIEKHTVGTAANFRPVPEDILPELAAQMRGEQIVAFQKVSARWTALKPRGPIDGPIRMLIRGIKDPELGLSAEDQAAAYAILGEAQTESRKVHNQANIAKYSAQAREKILKLLKGEQRAHYDKTINALAADRKAVREYAAKWFGSRGRVMPSHLSQPVPWEK